MSLRARISLAMGALAAVATLAVGVAGYRSTADRLQAELDRSLTEAMALLPSNERGEITALPIRGPIALYEAQILDGAGRVRLTTLEQAAPPDAAALRTVGRPRLVAVSTVASPIGDLRVRTVGLRDGAVQIARPLAETERVLDGLRTRTAVVVLLVTAAAALLGSVIAGTVTAGLRRLTGAAETVATTGRLDVEVAPPSGRGHDEVERLGAAFGSMLAALEASQAEQRRLVQDAGHELRTPLTSMRTNLEVLRRHPDLPDDQRRQIVDDLHAETAELVALVEEVVAVAVGDADDEPRARVVLGELAREVAERFERRTGRSVVVDADDAEVVAQPAAVQRAISNLVDNARKFDPSGGPIEVRVQGGRIDVADRGPGIAGDERELVFARFHRSASARTLPGSGLGLSIVRDVAVRHGGDVHVAERDGGGAVVGFTLPVAAPWAPPPPDDR